MSIQSFVYMLNSISQPDRYYIGHTENLEQRLRYHNSGQVQHTSKYVPWKIETVIMFRNKEKALAFEKYLKSHSGRAFAKKHF